MPQHHGDLHKRKPTGGKRKRFRKKRRHNAGSDPAETSLETRRTSRVRTRGGSLKTRLLSDEYANVYNPKKERMIKTKIVKVEANPANKDYDRRGVITRGTVIMTEEGKASVTSRPGQDGVINAIIIES